jgi:gluconokinase
MRYIIGIDIGTSGTKAIAYASGGQVLSSAYQSYSAISLHPGEHELDPDVLLEAVVKTVNQVLQKQESSSRVCGLSFSCAMHSLIAVDKSGTALTRAMTWADLRSKEFAARLKNTENGRNIYEHTGTPIHPMSPLCKIMWLKEKEPKIFQHTEKFISIKEYIWFRFFGKFQVDYSIASATGLFDIYSLKWYEQALLTAGITKNHLSEPVPPIHIERLPERNFQDKLGISGEIPFVIGANDGCLANLGSRAVHPGEMALTIGTSGAARMISTKPRHDPQGRIFNYILTEQLYVSGGPINNGGVAVKWWIENFIEKTGSFSDNLDAYLTGVSSIPPGSDGLIFLPYLLGERAPIWDADAKAVFFGIRSNHGSQHFLRSVIEGISFSLYQIGLSLEETIGRIKKIYASGGFIQSAIWLQLIADVFNREVSVTSEADASAMGAAIMGWHALGEIDNLQEPLDKTGLLQTYYPDENNHKIYMKNFSIFARLYDKLKDELHESF